MDEQIVNQPTEIKSKFPKSRFIKLGLVLGGLLLVILVFGLGFFAGSSRQILPVKFQAVPTPTPTPITEATVTPSPIPIGEIKWKTYDGPVYKFKYPEGWHVYVSLVGEYSSEEEMSTSEIIISSTPIVVEPHMGLGKIIISDRYRDPNSTKPDLNFDEFLNDTRKSWRNLKESSFENDKLKFIKFEGERLWMGEDNWLKMVAYYFRYDETVGGSNKIIKHIGTVEILGCQDLTSQECKVKDEIIKSLRRI